MIKNTKLIIIVVFLPIVFYSAYAINKNSAVSTSDNLPLLAESTINSIEFGKTKLRVFKKDQLFLLKYFDVKNNKLITERTLEFNGDYRKELSQIEIFSFNLNNNSQDDFIISHSYPIGAGPRAGMEVIKYFAFLNKNNKYINFDENRKAQEYLDNHDDINSIEEIKKLYINLYNNKKPTTLFGIVIPDRQKKSLLLLKNENLILTFKREKSKKRVTIAVDKNQKYLIYRYGTPKKIELTYKKKRDEKKDKFHYIQEDNYGYKRYEIKKLVFSINTFVYSIYDNYIESHKTAKDGIGVFITNIKSNKTFILKGDKTSKLGNLGQLKNAPWIKVTTIAANDYADE